MKVFTSINFNTENKFESISLVSLNDNIYFEEPTLTIAWYDLIYYITQEGLYQINLPVNLYEIIDNDKNLVLKYFCVDKEDFLDEEAVKELSYEGRKKVMEVIVPKKLKTFAAYKKYIIENRAPEVESD